MESDNTNIRLVKVDFVIIALVLGLIIGVLFVSLNTGVRTSQMRNRPKVIIFSRDNSLLLELDTLQPTHLGPAEFFDLDFQSDGIVIRRKTISSLFFSGLMRIPEKHYFDISSLVLKAENVKRVLYWNGSRLEEADFSK